MKYFLRIIQGFLCMALCVSCGADLFDFANRNLNQPTSEKPGVECFVELNTIRVFWDDDPAADEYMLYRSESSNVAITAENLVYAGQGLSHTDTGLEGDTMYFYRLRKRRAEQYFPTTFTSYLTAMGAVSEMIRDEYEDNDVIQRATAFQDVMDANLYYCEDVNQNVIQDVDWYKITVNPNRTVTLGIWCPEGVDGGISEDMIQFSDGPSGEYVSVTDSTVEISNPGTTAAEINFRIRLQPAGSGIYMGTYQVYFASDTPYEGS